MSSKNGDKKRERGLCMGVCPPRMEIQRREGMCVCETHNGIQKDKASSISNFKRTIKSISYDM